MVMQYFKWNSMEGLAKPFFQYEEMRSRRIVALLGWLLAALVDPIQVWQFCNQKDKCQIEM